MAEQKKIHDVIIIGGGPAGSTAATNLSMKGLDVLLLEKEQFPRFHIGESLLPFCYPIFEELGVLDIMKKEFHRKPGATFSDPNNDRYSHWCFNKVIHDPSYLSFHVERSRFDEILLNNSSAKGARVFQRARVTKLDLNYGDLVEVAVEHERTGRQNYLGKFILDASGQGSFIGKQLGCKESIASLSPRVAYFSHWENSNHDTPLANGTIRIVMLGGEKKGWIWMIPLGENRMSIGVAVDTNYVKWQKQQFGGDPQHSFTEQFYLNELRSSSFVANMINGASMLQEVSVISDYSYNVSTKYGEKFALIGDASKFLDPIFSTGVFLAMKSAMEVTNALVMKFQEGAENALETVYKDLEGGYQLVEKMITTFYDPETIKFPESTPDNVKHFDKYEDAFAIMHLILAGDFFKNHKKYMESIGVLTEKKKIESFKHLTTHTQAELLQYCPNPEK